MKGKATAEVGTVFTEGSSHTSADIPTDTKENEDEAKFPGFGEIDKWSIDERNEYLFGEEEMYLHMAAYYRSKGWPVGDDEDCLHEAMLLPDGALIPASKHPYIADHYYNEESSVEGSIEKFELIYRGNLVRFIADGGIILDVTNRAMVCMGNLVAGNNRMLLFAYRYLLRSPEENGGFFITDNNGMEVTYNRSQLEQLVSILERRSEDGREMSPKKSRAELVKDPPTNEEIDEWGVEERNTFLLQSRSHAELIARYYAWIGMDVWTDVTSWPEKERAVGEVAVVLPDGALIPSVKSHDKVSELYLSVNGGYDPKDSDAPFAVLSTLGGIYVAYGAMMCSPDTVRGNYGGLLLAYKYLLLTWSSDQEKAHITKPDGNEKIVNKDELQARIEILERMINRKSTM